MTLIATVIADRQFVTLAVALGAYAAVMIAVGRYLFPRPRR